MNGLGASQQAVLMPQTYLFVKRSFFHYLVL
jgi:hypothetical protein